MWYRGTEKERSVKTKEIWNKLYPLVDNINVSPLIATDILYYYKN